MLLSSQAVGVGALGVVGAGSPSAAAGGVRALAAGGTCVDAALAAALIETVVLTPKCGLAGDLVALYVPGQGSPPEALVAVGPSPSGLGAALLERRALPFTGGLAVGVPGAPAGYAALASRGKLGLAAACAPAIELATCGFAWPEVCATLSREADVLLLEHQQPGIRLRPVHGPLEAGELVRLPGAARALAALATEGASLFSGAVGDAFVDRVRRAGGVIERDDLAAATGQWSAPVTAEVAGGRLHATPYPTHGPALLDALARWEQAGLRGLPSAVRAAVSHMRATGGDAPAGDGGTSVVAAVDASGGAVVVVHSLSFPQFGSGLVVEEYDLVCSNRAGRGFSSSPSSANFPHPGARPLTTLHAWMVAGPEPGRVRLGATPGGAQQVCWNAQTLAAMLAGGADLGEVVTSPRWHLDGDAVVAEVDAIVDLVDERTRPVPPLSERSAQLVVELAEPGGLSRIAADPRLGAAAIAR